MKQASKQAFDPETLDHDVPGAKMPKGNGETQKIGGGLRHKRIPRLQGRIKAAFVEGRSPTTIVTALLK